jgi:outer membrane protein OmpA-like peptidoglycan-associated protein
LFKRIFAFLFIFQSIQLLAQDKEDPCPLSEVKKAKKYYNEAIDIVRSNRNEARMLLGKALEIDPEFARANYMIADLLIKGKKAKEAEPYLLKVATLCPDLDPMVFFRLGAIAFGEKRFAECNKFLQKFLDSDYKKEKERNEATDMIASASFFLEGFSKPVPFDPKPLQAICTSADEYLPIITPDNKFAYFTRSTFEVQKGLTSEPKRIERFSVSNGLGENNFEKGIPMTAPFNKNNNEGGATLSADNKNMYFTICKNDGGDLLNCDIWYSYFSKGVWAEIKNAGIAINGKNTWESQPSLSSDGKTLYFASSREGGFGELDIWKSTKDAKGIWSAPENLGPEINTKGSEKSPFFHSDGKTLYFSSTGHQGYGGYDIYFSKLEDNNVWQIPKNIGFPINSEKDDLGFFVSTDGKSGYFASDKIKGVGGWDIYSFPLYKEARPERVVFVSGELRNEKNEIITDATVEIKNTRTKEVKNIDVDSLTGKYVAVVAFNDDQLITVKKEGKAFTSQYLSTADSSLNIPKKMDIKMEEIKVGKAYKINNINFGVNSYLINKSTLDIVEELTTYLKENPTIKIAIHGHTDNVGDANSNLKLSNDRAKIVQDLLILNDITAERLSYKGFGATKPIAPNTNEKGRALNRRTEFLITEK